MMFLDLPAKLLACSIGAYPIGGTLHLRDLGDKLYTYESFQEQYKVSKQADKDSLKRVSGNEKGSAIYLMLMFQTLY